MTDAYPAAPEMASLDLIRRPLRDLLVGLLVLPVTERGQPGYAAADPDLLIRLAESAELVLRIVHDGFSAIGLLHACTAQQIANGEISATHTGGTLAACWSNSVRRSRTCRASRSIAGDIPLTMLATGGRLVTTDTALTGDAHGCW